MTKLSKVINDLLCQNNAVRHYGEFEDGYEAALIEVRDRMAEHDKEPNETPSECVSENEQTKMVLSQEVLGLCTVRPTESLTDFVKDVLKEFEELKKEIKLLEDSPCDECVECNCEHDCAECECEY